MLQIHQTVLRTYCPNPLFREAAATTVFVCLAHFIQITAKHQKITGICVLLQYHRRLKLPLRDPEEKTWKHIKDEQLPHYPIWAPGLWQERENEFFHSLQLVCCQVAVDDGDNFGDIALKTEK